MFKTWLLAAAAMVGAFAVACGGDDAAFTAVQSNLDRASSPDIPAADAAELQAGNAAFAFDLYRELGKADTGNLFFSPHSISTALAMTYAGARGATAQEMAGALHFALPQDRLHPALNGLDQDLASRNDVKLTEERGDPPELHVANSIWGEKDYQFLGAFLDALAVNYGTGLRLLDFRNEPDGSRKVINGWVEDQTRDRIKDLIPEGAIDGMTRLVLTNAVYFKGSWLTPFVESRTEGAPFTRLDGSRPEVQMMHASGVEARYSRMGSLQAVELPYVGREVSMLILVPDEGRFNEVDTTLDDTVLSNVVTSLKQANVTLAMPKFEFEWALSLNDALRGLGMASAFDSADFSGMDGTRNLAISDVLHKSFVSVDERGTEAAAATAVIMRETSAPQVVELTIDRPFIFLIRDKPTGAILFLGRFTSPD